MDLFTIHHRYKIRDYLGGASTIVLFSARDSLKNSDVLCTLIAFPGIDEKLWLQLLCYYERLVSWLQKDEAGFLSPIIDFGEIAPDRISRKVIERWNKSAHSSRYACYFITPLKTGWRLLADKPLGKEVCPYLLAVLQALGNMHSQGLFCYNLSPWSILCKDPGEVSLINAGIVPPGHLAFPRSPYSAPWPLLRKVDGRFDLYSLAASFYFLATGELFSQKDRHFKLLQKAGIAEPVAGFLRDCLSMDFRRFSTAARSLCTLRETLAEERAVASRRLYQLPLTPDYKRPSLLKETERHIFSLASRPYRPQKLACFFNGASGSGKTRSLVELQNFCSQNKTDAIYLPLCPNTSSLPPTVSLSLREQEHVAEKVIAPLVDAYFIPSIEESYLSARERIVRHILKRAQHPLVLLIDNLHWAGEELIDVLRALLLACAFEIRSATAPPRLLITGAGTMLKKDWRNFVEMFAKDELLCDFVIAQSLPKRYSHAGEIIASTLGIKKGPEIFTARLSEVTGGNPLYLQQTLSALLCKDTLYWEDGEWYMEAESVEQLKLPKSMENAANDYRELLDSNAKNTLELIGRLGFPVKFSLLASQPCEKLVPTLWRLYRDRVLAVDDRFAFYLSSATLWTHLQKLDASNIIALGQPDESDVFLLAHAHLKRGQYDRAYPHITDVLQCLLASGLDAIARSWLKKYLACRKGQTAKRALYIGEVALLLKEYQLALVCLDQAQKGLKDNAWPLLRLAEVAIKQKDVVQATAHLKSIRAVVKQKNVEQAHYYWLKGNLQRRDLSRYWQKALDLLFGLLKSPGSLNERRTLLTFYCRIVGNELFDEMCEHRGKWLQKGIETAQPLGSRSIFMYLLRLSAAAQKDMGHYELALDQFQKSLELARKLFHPAGEALALLGIAEIYLELAHYKKAEDNLLCAQELSAKNSMEMCRGHSDLLSGRLLCCLKKYREAIKSLQRALLVLHKIEKKREVAFALGCLSKCYLGLEDMANALDFWDQGRSLARKTGYPRLEIYFNLLKARIDNYEGQKAAKVLCLYNKPIKLAKQYGYLEYLWRLYYQKALTYQNAGEIEKALQYFRLAREIIENNARELAPELRESYLTSLQPKAIGDTLAMLTEEIPYPAQDILSENVTKDSKIRESTMDENFSRLEEIVSDCQKEVESTHLNALRKENENLKKLLEINKKLNCEHHLQRLLDFIMDTAIEITKAERGFLILSSTKREKMFEVARNFEHEDIINPHFEISHSITEKVIRTGLPILSKDALEEFDGYQSVSELKLHSLLAVPLRIRERILGALYIDNRFERAVFSEREKVLLEAFADQAAIAIENTRLIQENSALNARLAKKVESQKEELRQVKDILDRTHSNLRGKYRYYNIIGRSAPIEDVFKIMDKVADKNIPIFIHGESGTGKELVAKAIHFNSARKDKGFLSENCASFSDSLLESELFGHVKGAFTGAYCDKKGMFELADKGTLFLDEVGDMSPSMQASLLRVLENNLIRRVGGKEKIPIDVRLISASNKDLKKMVEKGEFRKDLFFRLKVVQIDLPPLRQRKEDISLLIEYFIKEYARENSCKERQVDKKALQLFMKFNWPGNIRELRNVIYNALSISDAPVLSDVDFRELLTPSSQKSDLFSEELSIDEYAKRFVLNHQGKYNDSQLSRILGFSRKTLWEKRKKWELFRS